MGFSTTETPKPPPLRSANRTRSSKTSSGIKYILIGALFFIIDTPFAIFFLSHRLPISDDDRQPQNAPLPASLASSLRRKPETKIRQQQQQPQKVDGTFNGAPITLRTTTNPHSSSHCVGDNFQADAWKQRSCHYSFMCFNTTANDYVIFQSKQEQELVKALADMNKSGNPWIRSSSTLSQTIAVGKDSSHSPQSVSIGGINQRWGKKGIKRLEWSPKVVHVENDQQPLSYYELPPSAVMMPFHSLSGSNPGHLIWDDFLSMWSLLDMFDLVDREMMLMRYVLHGDGIDPLWVSCDWETKKEDCEKMITKFLPLLVGNNAPYQLSTTLDFDFQPHMPGQSDLVCARTAVAGIGSLTDHGVEKTHGWELSDYQQTHNHGRGPQIYAFRNFCLNKLGLPITHSPSIAPRRIVFSQSSSELRIRSTMFEMQMEMAQKIAPTAQIEGHVLKKMSMQDQIQMMTETSMFLSFCGGGTAVATFLPRGASVILFYTHGARRNDKDKNRDLEAFLDWDLFQSMSHLRVHWVNFRVLQDKQHSEKLMQLIAHEIAIMDSQALE